MYFSTVTMNNGTLSAVANSQIYGAYLFNNSSRTITANGASNMISGIDVIGGSSGIILTLNTP